MQVRGWWPGELPPADPVAIEVGKRAGPAMPRSVRVYDAHASRATSQPMTIR